ncbi:hypothetical protein [Cryobacterium sp. TMT4-31]|nr:hypothetical protein [Cryobacterium sp. TMT4-31]
MLDEQGHATGFLEAAVSATEAVELVNKGQSENAVVGWFVEVEETV